MCLAQVRKKSSDSVGQLAFLPRIMSRAVSALSTGTRAYGTRGLNEKRSDTDSCVVFTYYIQINRLQRHA
jgi:hypothetical protein